MFFPLYDDNPTSIRPYVTQFIVVACSIVFVFQFLAGMPGQLFLDFGFIPDRFFSNSFFDLTIISSMFLHGGIAHIVGNMVYLWIFGDNVEESMGRIRFVLFYITCGLIAALSQALVSPDSNIPMVGASGAIAGVLGAYRSEERRVGKGKGTIALYRRKEEIKRVPEDEGVNALIQEPMSVVLSF